MIYRYEYSNEYSNECIIVTILFKCRYGVEVRVFMTLIFVKIYVYENKRKY